MTLDLSTGSIVLSVIGAGLSLLDTRLLPVGVVVFVLGLITGVVAFRRGRRRNRAMIGIVLNAANLAVDAAFVIFAASR
jgi:hypothetical protein